jgi:hypothetical protein
MSARTPPERWELIQRIFLAAVDLPVEERLVFLDQSCEGDAALRSEVESLLRAESPATTPLADYKEAIAAGLGSLFAHSRARGLRIGAYRLIREIGRGGMGSVYLASRDDSQYELEVAIKLVRPGLDTDFILERFRRERQILARLSHPNIARLLDGGTTEEEIPYLVMEYVDGPRITSYAEQKSLSVENRLRLFQQVCSAADYAHRSFIVHRDIKPGNILVDQTGVPKLLDFGISKLLHSTPQDTQDGQGAIIGTPDYASPEQIVGQPVTPLSDVYSLGAVLYELLTNQRPHRIEQRNPEALERAVCQEPVVLPSMAVKSDAKLTRKLRGDLDTIVLCAMHKNPERRYPSARHLADDVQRYLDRLPLMAGPDSVAYRASHFMVRHRAPVALTTAAVVAVVGMASYTWQQQHAGQDRILRLSEEEREAQFTLAETDRQLGAALGSSPEAVRAYAAMLAISQSLWEADPRDARARNEYGDALLDLAVALPQDPSAQKRAALERARSWLAERVRQSPGDSRLREQFDDAVAALARLENGASTR